MLLARATRAARVRPSCSGAARGRRRHRRRRAHRPLDRAVPQGAGARRSRSPWSSRGWRRYGASGRNAGMLSETVDHGHGLAIEHFGEAEARGLARLGETNVAELTAFLEARGIRCDYEPTGRLMVALTPAQVEEARRTVETARRLGLDSFHLLDRAAVRAEVAFAALPGRGSRHRRRDPRPGEAGGWPSRRGGAAGRAGVRAEPGRRRSSRRARRPRPDRARRGGGPTGRPRDQRLYPPSAARGHPAVHPAVRLHPGERSAHPGSARGHRLAEPPGRDRRPDVLQLLPTHRGRPRPVGHERGGLLPGQPGGSRRATIPRRTMPPCARASAATFPGSRALEFPYAWGGPICSTTRMTPYLRPGPGRPALLRAGLHGPRAGHDAAGRADPRPSGAGPAERAAGAVAGEEEAVSVSAGADAVLVGGRRDPRAPAGRRGRAAGCAACGCWSGWGSGSRVEGARGRGGRAAGHPVSRAQRGISPGISSHPREDPSLRSG